MDDDVIVEELFLQLIHLFEEIDEDDSSSDSSSDEEEDLFADDDYNPRRKKPRVQNFIADVIDHYNDSEFRENYRMSRQTFQHVLELLREDLEGPIDHLGRSRIPADKQLYIALYYLGTPDSYRSIITKFDVAKATAWQAVKRVVAAICRHRSYFIRWPTHEEAHATMARIEEQYGFPNVIGAVDGTQIRIAAPKVDPQAYINRKGFHAIQLQVVCNDKLEFIHCFTGPPGSVHDMRVFKYSGIQQRCTDEFFPNHSHLLGDSAYVLQKHVMIPYKDNGHRTVEQIHFNTLLSSARMMVERAIGLLKLRFRILLDKQPMTKTALVPYYILACCILHNICLQQNDDFDHFLEIPNVIDAHAEPLQVTNEQKQQGTTKRDFIKDILGEIIILDQ